MDKKIDVSLQARRNDVRIQPNKKLINYINLFAIYVKYIKHMFYFIQIMCIFAED